jgi:hypothetical protein
LARGSCRFVSSTAPARPVGTPPWAADTGA